MAEPYGLGYQQVRRAASGGRGSFSYADTTVFGARQLRAADPVAVWRPGTPTPETPQIVVAGSGGGVRANRSLPFGSYAPGFSPHGIVLIRLTRVE